MQGLDFSVVLPYADVLAMGVWWTVLLTVSAGALSFICGIVFAVPCSMLLRLSPIPCGS